VDDAIVFAPDPTIFELGPIDIRWYGTMFMLAFWLGFALWYHYARRGGYSREVPVGYLPWFLVSLAVGARLGHCLFYEPERYLSDPVEILKIWEGGLSSHGATVGLLAGLYLFAGSRGLRYLDIVDRFAPSTAVAAALVRVGNLMNSEIAGRPTDLPWGLKLPRRDCEPTGLCGVLDAPAPESHPGWRALVEAVPARHPTQLYEALIGAGVLLGLVIVDRLAGRERRPVGLITGAFAVMYFGARFLVEFWKEHQTLAEGSALTMGQLLSIPLFLIGVWLIARGYRSGLRAKDVPIPSGLARGGRR
jgi:phosphatidylglycerol---prolipoprotein diacylglyceryl transferase